MHPYLAHAVQLFGPVATLYGYIITCFVVTFLLTAVFCPLSTTHKKTTTSTLNNIDFLKIILTYVIILHHQYQALQWSNHGFYGVEFFFIISGFMLNYTFSPKKETLPFIKNKLFRFVPYIFLGSCLELFAEFNFNLTKFLSGIFMFNCTGFYPEHAIYGPTWYLTVLFWVSLGYFQLLKNCKTGMCNLIIGIITFLTLSVARNINALYQPLTWFNEDMPLMTNAFTRGLAMMGIGYFLACSYTQKQSPQNKYITVLAGLVEIALIIFFGITFFVEKYFSTRCVIVVSATYLTWSFIHQKGFLSQLLNKINWRPVSKYMLSIYMTHWVICRMQAQLDLWNEYQPTTRIALCMICGTILGVISYYVVHWGYKCSCRLYKK